MVQQLAKEPSTRLLKHVVRCYLRLSDNLRYAVQVCKYTVLLVNSWSTHTHTHTYICDFVNIFVYISKSLIICNYMDSPPHRSLTHTCKTHRAREALRSCLPDQLKDNMFANTLKDDSTTKKWLSQLLQNLGLTSPNTAPQPVESGEALPTTASSTATTSTPA